MTALMVPQPSIFQWECYMMKQTELHPQLLKDCLPVVSLSACLVLLMNDSHYPWLILVPDGHNLRDWDDVSESDIPLVEGDVRLACRVLKKLFQPDKINVAALGNVVPQLHIHVIARFHSDKAWPKPVWGVHPPLPYGDGDLKERLRLLQKAFAMPSF